METATFVARFCEYAGPGPSASTSGKAGVEIKTKEGQVVSGLGTVCRYIAEHSPKGAQLLSGSQQQPQIDEWLSWANTELNPLVDDKLVKVNDWLQARTFLAGSSLTLADLVIFGVVQPAAVAFPVAQTLHFAALLRWFDLVQHLAGAAASVFPKRLELTKPQFQAPAAPPPAPVPAKAPAAAAPAAAAPAPAAAPAKDAAKGAAKGDAKAPAAAAAPASAPAPAPIKGKGEGDKKAAAPAAEAGDKKGSSKGAEPKKGGDDEVHIGMLDIRVGTIVKVDQHPNADALYLEEIDVGEDKPRQVISGLVKFVPKDKMLNRRVVVVCNLKPAKMREIMSYGMVLCSSNDAHDVVDPIIPPEGVPNGERITFPGYDAAPLAEVNPKKKILERLFPDMVTDASGTPNYKGLTFNTSKGPVTSTQPNAHVA